MTSTRDLRAAIVIKLSDMPPSANSLRKSFVTTGGKIATAKTKGYAAWRMAAAWEIVRCKPGRIVGPYRLSIAAQRNWRSKRARDIDNIIKPVSDALVVAGVVSDDSLAEEVSAKWADDLGGPAVVVIIQEAVEEMAA